MHSPFFLLVHHCALYRTDYRIVQVFVSHQVARTRLRQWQLLRPRRDFSHPRNCPDSPGQSCRRLQRAGKPAKSLRLKTQGGFGYSPPERTAPTSREVHSAVCIAIDLDLSASIHAVGHCLSSLPAVTLVSSFLSSQFVSVSLPYPYPGHNCICLSSLS